MRIILFGSSNPSGSAFLHLFRDHCVEIWGRKGVRDNQYPHVYCDLSSDLFDDQQPMRGILVSFAPIWLLSTYLTNLYNNKSELLHGLQGIVACSSSSFMTKRFAFNDFDKELAIRLCTAHLKIQDLCKSLSIPCRIVAPTLVYGRVNEFSDKNLSKILSLMRTFPFIILPRTTGQRQPIHAIQLAGAMKKQLDEIISGHCKANNPSIVVIGGDEILTYEDMIKKLKSSLRPNDPAKKCKLIKVPDRLYYLLSLPILPCNPKLFESLMRIRSNLSGFDRVHEIVNGRPQCFPVSDSIDATPATF